MKKQIQRKSTAEQIVEKGKKKQIDVVNSDNKNFIECINVLANTKEGQYVFNRLMEVCGHLKSSVSQGSTGIVDEGTVQYKEGRRSVFLYDIYKYLNVTNLKKVLFFDRRKLCSQKRKLQDKVD